MTTLTRRSFLVLALAALAIVLLLVSSTSAEQKIKKKHRKHHQRPTTTTEEPSMGLGSNNNPVYSPDEPLNKLEQGSKNELRDPCLDVHCRPGRVCRINDDLNAECVCIEHCTPETEPRRRVCTNYNETFGSDCEVHQTRCFCETDDPRCRGADYEHVHVEYYGECKVMPACKPEDMADFPRRMRDWLFNVMRDLADRQELTEHYLRMEREAENNEKLRWTNAAIWKWCDLDGKPHDRSVSRHELFPIRAPLMALEHCLAPFLDSCDLDADHKISLNEWGRCLGLDEAELVAKCDALAEARNEDQFEQ